MESRKRIVAAFPCSVRTAGIFLLVLAFCLFLSPSPDYAKMVKTPPKIVSGEVQSVSGGSVTVNRDHYDVSQAVILTVEGRKTTLSYIKPGDRVELVIEEGDVIKVRVDNRRIVK